MKNTELSVRYEAPEVVYVELNVEKGFAGSNDPLENEKWV